MPALGERAPNFTLRNDDGQVVALADFQGKIVVLNFWATWCAPCVEEMPSLDRLQVKLRGEGLVVLPLSVDGPTRKKVAPFYESRKLSALGIYFDDKRAAFASFDVGVLPTSILIGRDGREIGRVEGQADWDSPPSVAFLRRYLSAAG